MLIDLGDEVEIIVKVGGSSYKLKEPTQGDVEKLNKAGDSSDAFYSFVEGLGMPPEVLSNLGVLRLKKLADGLTKVLTEKK